KRRRLAIVLLLLWVALTLPAGWLTLRLLDRPTDQLALLTAGAPVGLAAAGLLLAVGYLGLTRLAGSHVRRVAQPLGVCFHAADARVRHLTTSLTERHDKQLKGAQFRHD